MFFRPGTDSLAQQIKRLHSTDRDHQFKSSLAQTFGRQSIRKAADFALIDACDVNHWIYHFRPNACVLTVIGGLERWKAP